MIRHEIKSLFKGRIYVEADEELNYTPIATTFDYNSDIYGGSIVEAGGTRGVGENNFNNALVIGEYDDSQNIQITCAGAQALHSSGLLAITDPYADIYIKLEIMDNGGGIK